MAKEIKENKLITDGVFQQNIENVLQEKMGSYSKYIILFRALPDARDGLKPVQRRILYAMKDLGLVSSSQRKKSARVVGETMGKYHPHGDSSIYEAMVNMSQPWKNNLPLIDFQGNNGSIDGDSAAASRYTEVRLSNIADEVLKNIEKDTVNFKDNYDETEREPTILPTLLPLLFINGITGVAIGFATDIPPFNLLEVLQATKALLKKPKITNTEIQTFIIGPDLPTGGKIIAPQEDIITYYETGEGKMLNEAEWHYDEKKNQIIFTSIPYATLKENIIKQLESMVIDGLLFGVKEVFDHSTKNEIKIILKMEKSFDGKTTQPLINLIFKNTELTKNLNPKNIAIVSQGNTRTPQTLSIKAMLENFVSHSLEIILRSSIFDHKQALKQKEITEGLLKAQSIMDELIALIRGSKNKAEAKTKIIEKWKFTELQTDAILALQLHRLTNTDVEELKMKLKELILLIETLEKLIADENERKKHFSKIIDKYLIQFKDFTRKTTIVYEKVDTKQISKELNEINSVPIKLILTKHGWIYKLENLEQPYTLQRGDEELIQIDSQTNKKTFFITEYGNLVVIKNDKIPFITKQNPTPASIFSFYTPMFKNEKVIFGLTDDYNKDDVLFIGTKNGMVKSTTLQSFLEITRTTQLMKLKDKDQIIDGFIVLKDDFDKLELFSISKNKMILSYMANTISPTGLKSQGILSHKLKNDDFVEMFFANRDLTLETIKVSKRIKIKKMNRKDVITAKRAQAGKMIK